jgi:hypothetical protein
MTESHDGAEHLNQGVYTPPDSPTLAARLSIHNSATDPVTLIFLTGQIDDLEIRDDEGKVVFLWSKGKLFAQIVTTVEMQDERDHVITAPLVGLRLGKYVAQGWLVVDGPQRAYSASARFEIK